MNYACISLHIFHLKKLMLPSQKLEIKQATRTLCFTKSLKLKPGWCPGPTCIYYHPSLDVVIKKNTLITTVIKPQFALLVVLLLEKLYVIAYSEYTHDLWTIRHYRTYTKRFLLHNSKGRTHCSASPKFLFSTRT
jgi:hypothetical protein